MLKKIVILLYILLIPAQSYAYSCKEAKKYYKYDKAVTECGFKFKSNYGKRFRCERKAEKKFKKFKKLRRKYEQCNPLSREDLLTELRGKYNINIWQEAINAK